jgi:hypothetical protein
MRVLCRHGHFSFYPRQTSDLAKFAQMFGLTLEREEDYFTFSTLKAAGKYSLAGKPYVNLPALETYEGNPWDVMRENNFVYHLGLDVLVPKQSIVSIGELISKGFFYVFSGPILQPGSRTITGDQIMSYSGEFYDDRFYLRILEFAYE